MEVKFIKNHPLFAHSVGDVCELTDEHTEQLLSSGHIVAYEGDTEEQEPAEEAEKEETKPEPKNEGQGNTSDPRKRTPKG